MTSLADVNATLGVQNIALSEVVKAQKETNTGISSFLEHIKTTDVRDRRENQEDEREAKKASVISDKLAATGGALKSAGGGLLGVGKKGLGFGKSALGKIGTLGTGFLGGLLSSKLLRFGIPAIGFLMGDRIAEMLAGPDAKKEVKDMLGGAIKGGALGFLLGPRFAAIGFILGGLLQDKKINQEVGNLITNLKELKIKFPALGDLFKKITNGIGIGLESINKLLDGQVNMDNILKGGAVIGGIATLLMPGKLLGMAFKAGRLLLMTPVGRAILFAAGGFKLIQSLVNSGGQTGNNARFMTGPEGDFDYGKQSKNIEENTKNEGMKIPGSIGEMSTLDQTIAGMMAGQLLFKGGRFVVNKMRTPNVKPQTSLSNLFNNVKTKQPTNIFTRMMNLVKTGGRHAMSMVRGLPVLLPLAAVAGLTYVLNNKESSEDLQRKTKANKIKGIMTPEGIKAGINITGGGGPEMMDGMLGLGKIYSDSPAMKKSGGGTGASLSDYFARNTNSSTGYKDRIMSVVDNSNSNNKTETHNSAAMFPNALSGYDLGDQIARVNPSFQGF